MSYKIYLFWVEKRQNKTGSDTGSAPRIHAMKDYATHAPADAINALLHANKMPTWKQYFVWMINRRYR